MTTICIPKLNSVYAGTVKPYRHLLYAGGDDLLTKDYASLSLEDMRDNYDLMNYLQSSYFDHDEGQHFYWAFLSALSLSLRFNTGAILLIPVELPNHS